MLKLIMIFVVTMLIAMGVTYAFAEDTIRECEQADGTRLYTNKATLGCTDILLPKVSIAPTRTYTTITPVLETTPRNIQAPASTTGARMCALYQEFLDVQETTMGGIFIGTDPDGISQRRTALLSIFGSGFVPMGCP